MSNYVQSVEQQRSLNRFLSQTYIWMILGLLVSAASAFVLLANPALLRAVYGSRLGIAILVIAQLVCAYSLRIDPRKLSNSLSYVIRFVLYAILTGFTFAVIALVYAAASIVQAFITTAALFAILAIYGYTTSRDLTKLGNVLIPALLALVLVSILNVWLFQSSTMELVLSVLSVIIFTGLTMYDAQKIKDYYLYFEGRSQMYTGLSIACALQLYLDFINLFLSILRIFGRTND